MERIQERSLVVSTVDYGEADRIVTLLTAGRGRLSAYAVGARKSKRRFAGALDPLTLIQAHLVERSGSTWRMDSADIERSYPGIRADLSRIARALYCLELCRELVREGEPHPELFRRLVGYLDLLEVGQAGPTSLIAFELDALDYVGVRPKFDACVLCQGVLEEGALFDLEHGGGVCGRQECRQRVRFGVAAPPELMTALARLQRGAREPMGPEQRRRAREALNHFIAHQLGHTLKSAGFMAQVGLD